MGHQAPGKSYREGISLIGLFNTYPDDLTRQGVVREQALARRPLLLPLRLY